MVTTSSKSRGGGSTDAEATANDSSESSESPPIQISTSLIQCNSPGFIGLAGSKENLRHTSNSNLGE